MDKLRDEMEASKQEKADLKQDLDKLQGDIDVIQNEINSLYDEKRKCHENYWKDRYFHKKQKEEIMHIEWMIKQKARVVEMDNEKKEIDKERQAQIQNMPHPYMREIDMCDQLKVYCHNLKVKNGLVADSAQVAREVDAELRKNETKEKLD